MRCPSCGHPESKVLDTRMAKNNASIRRRRECLACEYRFSTVEEILRENLRVIKVDGSREDFDRNKILNGIRKATDGRPVEMERIDMMVSELIDRLEKRYPGEIPTRAIGEEIMEQLRHIDELAYVRFAIAYKNIRDIAELEEQLSSIRG
ncbi:MAG: transcriptional regulator NrdR [Puniceicoccaceae bacterium]